MVIIVRHFEKPGFCDGEGGLVSFDNQVMIHLFFFSNGIVCDQSYRFIGPVLIFSTIPLVNAYGYDG